MRGLGLPMFLLGLAIGNPMARKMLMDGVSVTADKIEEEIRKATQQSNPTISTSEKKGE